MKNVIASILFILFLIFGITSTAQVTSNFNVDNEGWTVFDNNAGSSTAATYNSTGGNPGGYASFTTSSGALNMYWTAPAKFLGNQSFSYNQTISFDLDVSTAGADNSIGDVKLAGSGVTLYYQLPVKPVANSWPSSTNSYSVQLNEASWHVGSPTGTIATINQIKSVLVNLTQFQIRAKYLSGNTLPYTVKLDNVVMNKMSLQASPVITSFTPLSALAGTTITITGSNFNTTASQNLVYFKGVKTNATSATATQLTVKVPVSAPYGLLTVENSGTGLQGISTQSFSLLFDNNKDFGGQIIPASLTRGHSTLLQSGTETGATNNQNGNMDKGDIDGDGWVDLIATETGVTSAPKIYVYRNLGTGGSVSTSSFATPVILSLSTVPGGNPWLGELTVADVDSDGLLDVAAVSSSGGAQGYLVVFRNTSTSGLISFASPEFFGYPYYSSQLTSTSGDFDGDGRIDFAYTTGTSPGGIWMNQNLSTPGNVDFSYGFSIGTNLSHRDLAVGDLNSDGKPELIASLGNGFEIYQNNSSSGTIGFNAPFTIANTSVYNIYLADLDADNKLDLMWGDPNVQYIYFSRNIYSGSVLNATSFEAAFQIANSTGSTEGITVGDINADGKPDVILSGTYDLGILQNVGNGSLSVASFLATILFQGSAGGQPISSSAPVIADLDGDNKQEVMFTYTYVNITAAEKGIYIFHNESYPAPIVNSISPSSGSIGSTITLTGNFMFTKNTTPSARLNKMNSAISGSPTNTSTSVINPTGSISGRIAITNHGLTGYSSIFNSTFATDRVINTSSFGPSIDFALGGNTRDALEVADFDDDGKDDVVVVENYSTGKIFKNTQATVGQPITTSSLTVESTTYSSGYNITALDIDGDGKVDLNSGFNLLQNTTTGSISFGTGASTSAGGFNYVAAADFNKDGKTDLALTNGGASIQVYQNQSSKGTFPANGKFAPFNTAATSLPVPGGLGVVAADFDNDGYDDLISTNPNVNSFTVYLNKKVTGPLTTSSFLLLGNNPTTGTKPNNLTAKDFDSDGKIDIAITYFNSAFISVYRNISSPGDISFAAPVDIASLSKGYNIASQDLDGDGLAEIVVIHRPNPGPGSFSVFKNNSTSGSVNFATVVNYSVGTHNTQALAIADINLDQKPDILIVGDPYPTGTNALMVFENKINSGPVIAINPQPTSTAVCDGTNASFTLTATGAANLTFQWQKFDGSVFNNITNASGYTGVTTSTLNINTTGNFGAGDYRCKVTGDLAPDKFSNTVTLTVNVVPTAPNTTGASDCVAAALILNASGGSNGQYRWYNVSTGGTPISGQVNSAYTTPIIATTTTYFVSINNGSCESTRTPVIATIAPITKPTIFFDPPIFNAGSTINLCEGDLQKFSAPPGFTSYTWSNGEVTEEIVMDQSDVYSVVVEDAAGCVSPSSDPLNVIINPYPTATITVNDTQLTASSGDSYQWYQNGSAVTGAISQSFEFNLLEYGLYKVDVRDNGCTSTSPPFEYLITGIENFKSELKVYPNPITSDELLSFQIFPFGSGKLINAFFSFFPS
ncbi:MAG: FG-GAP-like repeat-containing protein [Chryseolinea sp.]